MFINVQCDACQAKFRVDEKGAGKTVKCPKCSHPILVPAAGSSPSGIATGANPLVIAKPIPVRAIRTGVPLEATAQTSKADSPQPMAAPFAIVTKTDKAASSSAKPHGAPKRGKASKHRGALLIAGGIGGVVLLLVASLAFMGGGETPPRAVAKAKKAPTSRSSSQPSKHEFEKPSSRNTRPPRANESVELTPPSFSLDQLPTVEDAPATETPAADAPATEPLAATTPAPAAGPVPRGFEGWTQLLDKAKDQAGKQNKEIVLLIGSSDGSPKTLRLAKALSEAGLLKGELAEKYIAVVIDLPQTRAGAQNILDFNQNLAVANEYGIREIAELPVLVLADAQGRPFAIVSDWTKGFDAMGTTLEKLAGGKAERDLLLAATKTEEPAKMLDAAVAAAKWIDDRKLHWNYRQEIHDWYELAEKLDPENKAGKLEVLLGQEMINRVAALNPNDNVAVAETLGMFDKFLTKQRFKDPDRGVLLHVLVGHLLIQANDPDQGNAHFKQATTYQPKNPTLRKQLALLGQQTKNADILGNGTAFVVGKDGYLLYLLTNRHVVKDAGRLGLVLPDIDEPLAAEVVKIDEHLDIALIKVEFPKNVQPRPLTIAPGDVRLSMNVSAYGFPAASVLGGTLSATTGYVSSLPNRTTDDMVGLNVVINPGNSGGPLCDNRGFVMGIVTAKTRLGAAGDSIGFAIKPANLRTFLKKNLPKSAQAPDVATQKDSKTTDKRKEFKNWEEVTKAVEPSVFMLIIMR